MLIERPSLVYKGGDTVILETGLDVVFVRIEVGRDDGYVAIP